MKTKTTLNDLYSFPGFRARSRLKGILGDSPARIVTLVRRQKKRHAPHAAIASGDSTIAESTGSEIKTPVGPGSTWNSSTDACAAGAARP